ncbi:MAG: phosphoglucosamine mutase [Myxococcota bacterium]|jgi:phosphoglucosamine mutase
MSVQFGTDGVRGPAGQMPITAEVGVAVGRAVAEWAGGPILVARDPRPSGPGLAAAVGAGAASQGAAVIDAGVAPTPAVGCALAAGMARAAVVVTASHNSWPDNGFKVLGPGGRKPTPDDVAVLEALIMAPPAPSHPFAPIMSSEAIVSAWLDRLVPSDALAGARIAVDFSNGAGAVAQDWLRRSVPAQWTFIGVDGLPNDGCGSEHLEALGDAVRTHGCALGIALDGDGDRCRIVDERGKAVSGDAVTWLLARDLGVTHLAVTVMSNGALEVALPGVQILRTPVGDKHLQAALEAGQATLGAEESGHILFSDHPAGDGLLAGLRIADAALRRGAASAVFAEFRPLPRRLAKLAVHHRPPLADLPALTQATALAEATLGPGGRVYLRYSGTEPVLRLLVEGATQPAVEAALDAVTAVAAELLA